MLAKQAEPGFRVKILADLIGDGDVLQQRNRGARSQHDIAGRNGGRNLRDFAGLCGGGESEVRITLCS